MDIEQLKQLGITVESLQERIIERISDQILNSTWVDEDGDETKRPSQLHAKLIELVKKRIDAAINRIAEIHVLPRVTDYVENIVITETNGWGEKNGKTFTFIEYLVSRAEHYLTEKVNYEGKGKYEAKDYSWSGSQTRITHLVNNHLHYSIETAMKEALKIATSAISTGIQETVKIKLGEISSTLKCAVTLK